VAIDGRPVSAVNAQGRHVPTATREPVIAQIEARVAGDRPALEAADEPDEAGPPGGARAADLQTTSEARRGRRRRDEDLQAAVARRGPDQRSRTAPARRAMPGGHGGGTAGCEHVQTAVEAPHTRIVAGEVTNDPTDRDWLRPVAVAAQAVLGGPCDAVADGGDAPGPDVKPGLPAGRTPSSARPLPSAHQPLGLCSYDDGTDEAATDTDRWPAGERRRGRVDPGAHARHRRSSATSACRTGPLKAQGTRHTGGRRITRGVDEPGLAPMEPHGHTRPERMPQRKALVEQPWGTMTRGGDQGDGLRRGVARGRAECRVTVWADHLRRVLHLVALTRRLASVGSGGPGGPLRTTERRLILATRA
jgi:hypothetical protein